MNEIRFDVWVAGIAIAISATLLIALVCLLRRRRHPKPCDVMEHIGNAWVTAEYIKRELEKSFPAPINWRRLYATLDRLEAERQVSKRFHSDLSGKGHRQYRLSSAPPDLPTTRKAV